MRTINGFAGRVLDALVANNCKVCDFKYNVPTNTNLYSLRRLRTLESTRYDVKDIRGLSKVEKDYIIDNGMKCYTDIEGVRYYIFIERDLSTGKKRIYAQTKQQLLDPCGKYFHVCDDGFNYDKWLIFRCDRYKAFSRFDYERRFVGMLSPISL